MKKFVSGMICLICFGILPAVGQDSKIHKFDFASQPRPSAPALSLVTFVYSDGCAPADSASAGATCCERSSGCWIANDGRKATASCQSTRYQWQGPAAKNRNALAKAGCCMSRKQ